MTKKINIDGEDIQPTLLDVLTFRDASYNSLTEAAFISIRNKLNAACCTFLKIETPINWVKIETVSGIEGFVSVSGIVCPPIGNSILIDENVVEITTDNFEKYKRPVRFILPIRLLDYGDTEEIINFIIVTGIICLICP